VDTIDTTSVSKMVVGAAFTGSVNWVRLPGVTHMNVVPKIC